MEGHLEVKLCFLIRPLKFGVEVHTKAPTGVALRLSLADALRASAKQMNMQQQRGACPAAKEEELQRSSPSPSRNYRQVCSREQSEKSVRSEEREREGGGPARRGRRRYSRGRLALPRRPRPRLPRCPLPRRPRPGGLLVVSAPGSLLVTSSCSRRRGWVLAATVRAGEDGEGRSTAAARPPPRGNASSRWDLRRPRERVGVGGGDQNVDSHPCSALDSCPCSACRRSGGEPCSGVGPGRAGSSSPAPARIEAAPPLLLRAASSRARWRRIHGGVEVLTPHRMERRRRRPSPAGPRRAEIR
jgi:hypothetical protein